MRNLPEQNKSTVIAGLTRNPPARSENEEIAAQGRNDTNIFKEQLLALIPDLDAQCDGVLIHSENFQALGLMQEKYREQVKTIYIDPPYNTSASEIAYKNSYKHSSWLCLMQNRLEISKYLQDKSGVKIVAIDDAEMVTLCGLLDSTYLEHDRNMVVVNHHPAGAGLEGTNISATHEYAIFMTPKSKKTLFGSDYADATTEISFIRTGTADSNLRIGRPNSFYALLIDESQQKIVGIETPPTGHYPIEKNNQGFLRVYPVSADGTERVWRRSYESAVSELTNNNLIYKGGRSIYLRSNTEGRAKPIFSNWTDTRYNAGVHGSKILANITGENKFSYPKSLFNVQDCIHFASKHNKTALVLDYFGGSGTTAHAVINLNREDNGSRNYILVEQNAYFDTVLKPRIQKVVYSRDWKDGKPKPDDTGNLNGISHCFKTIRLESYEDTLNNLVLRTDVDRDHALTLNADLRRDYLLNYALDVETQGSNSLLNIAQFNNPFAYQMRIKRPNSDEQAVQSIDLIETFNWLIGLWVTHSAARVILSAEFSRERDPDLPNDQATRLVATLSKAKENDAQTYTFKLIEGYTLARAGDDSSKVKTLVVWRTLTEDGEQDNAVLQAYLVDKLKIRPRESMYEVIYVNGSHTLPNPVIDDANIKVRLIEEAFMNAMWQVQDV